MSEEERDESETIKLRVTATFKGEVEQCAADLQLNTSALTRLALAEYIEKRSSSKAGNVNIEGAAV